MSEAVDLEARALWHAELVSAREWKFGADLDEPEPEPEDDFDDSDETPICEACAGTGGDPMNDFILPCERCDGEGVKWWLR